MKSFLQLIIEALRQTESIAPDEILQATNFMKARMKELSRIETLCLNCQNLTISAVPCNAYKRYGEDWLEGLRKKWVNPPVISIQPPLHSRQSTCKYPEWMLRRIERESFTAPVLKVNGYSSTILQYTCPTCSDQIEGLIRNAWGQREAERQRNEERDRLWEEKRRIRDKSIVDGNTPSTITERFHSLERFFLEKHCQALRKRSYSDFLGTTYWDIVRRYVLYKRGWKCELCNEKGELRVHHKTYEHHGKEHLHLEDLITLCNKCHRKFHDKLATVA